jgi:hypothetical protein
MPRALKVYFAPLGFFESVVAAPSQAAALRAWGVHQDLFASGDAKVTAEPDAVEAAMAHPGAPLKRPVGGKGAFRLDPDLPRAPEAKRGERAPPKPDRAPLAAAEARLEHIEEAQARGEAEFFARREALEAEEAAARKRWAADCKQAQADVQRERRAFAKAGGHP